MTFTQWLFGGIDNPYKGGQWGPLHIATLVVCAALIVGFYFLVKHSRHQEKTRKAIVLSLVAAIAFFEVTIRFVHCMKLFYFHQAVMDGLTWYWIALPRPWCAVACWSLIASVFVKKPFFYNYACLSALLCSFIFFCYPGVGYNNVYLTFENWYSILTHALLLVTSLTLITLKYAEFAFCHFGKMAIAFALTFVYGFIEIFVLKIHADPMYFMPNGDIQAGILRMDYTLYLVCYIVLFLLYITVPYLIGEKSAKEVIACRK